MKHTLSDHFTQLDISPQQSRIYLTLLNSGPLSITQLSKQLNTPRTTPHENIDRLIQKGLLTKTVHGSIKKLLAEPPTKLEVLLSEQKAKINDQQQRLSQVESTLPNFIKSLYQNAKEHKNTSDIQVKIVEGKKNVFDIIYKEVLQVDEAYSFSNLDKYYEVYPDTLEIWYKALKNNPKRHFFDITVDSKYTITNKIRQKQNPYSKRYHFKTIPATNFFSNFEYADYLFYNQKVALVQLEPQKIMGIVINSPFLYEGFKGLHKTMWELLPDL